MSTHTRKIFLRRPSRRAMIECVGRYNFPWLDPEREQKRRPPAMEAQLNSREWSQEVGKRPERVSLRLLPFGPDRVGESFARTNLSPLNLVRLARIGKVAFHNGCASRFSGSEGRGAAGRKWIQRAARHQMLHRKQSLCRIP